MGTTEVIEPLMALRALKERRRIDSIYRWILLFLFEICLACYVNGDETRTRMETVTPD